VLRQFERVRALLEPEGLFAVERKRSLPKLPRRIALLTSVPSSALADMLRTARERWPATGLLVVPIPVQGAVEEQIVGALSEISTRAEALAIDAVVLARGGGSREDLAVFDGVALARCLAQMAVPVVCGLGHEDDTTVADLVADHRAATPTAAIVALLPDRQAALQEIGRSRAHLQRSLTLRLEAARHRLVQQRSQLTSLHPIRLLENQRRWLAQQRLLLQALSPQHLLARGFSLLTDGKGLPVRSLGQLRPGEAIEVQVVDGRVRALVEELLPATTAPSPPPLPHSS
jgi:exodeoxyribonuclease VII large subunit